jgi:hypothetical protein
MRTPIKTTKKTIEDLSGAYDIYDAEVSSGEYEPELWDIDESSNTILLDHAKGAAMFLNCLNGEIQVCENVMYEEPESYGIAYRMIKRMRRLEAIVLEKFGEQVERDMYGCWKEVQA